MPKSMHMDRAAAVCYKVDGGLVIMAFPLQTYGLQLEMRLRAWLVSCAYPPDQHDAKADSADMAMFSDSQGKMARQGRTFSCLHT